MHAETQPMTSASHGAQSLRALAIMDELKTEPGLRLFCQISAVSGDIF